MRITTAQLKTGWLHPQRVVRNVVATHFVDACTTDPDVTAHAIRGARQFGWQRFLTWGHRFSGLPLADAGALEWVCGEVERIDGEAPSDNLKGHLARMLTRAEITLAERHRSRILALVPLSPHDRQALLTRLELAACPPAEAWRRLEDHCRMAASGETFADARIAEAELLLEPLERAGRESVARVMDVLGNPPPAGSGDDPLEWLTGLMIVLAGRLRLEEAAPRIWDLLTLDWDWYHEAGEAALAGIGTPGVVRLVGSRYPEATWGTRLCATTLLTRVRCEESAAVIEEALRGEDDAGLRGCLGLAAAAQFDDRPVVLARRVLDEAPDDPNRRDIRELLVAFSHLSGWELPERDDWEQDIDAFDDRISRLGDPAESPLADFFPHPDDDDDDENFAADELDVSGWEDDDDSFAQPLQRATRVGRNAPCPCGSGKKHKRCCLGAEPAPE